MPNLNVMRMDGNSIVLKIKFYRRMMAIRCEVLQYLDDPQITEGKWKTAEAFFVGGKRAEMEVRLKIKAEKRAKEIQDLKDFCMMQKDILLKSGGNLDDFHDLMSSDSNDTRGTKK